MRLGRPWNFNVSAGLLCISLELSLKDAPFPGHFAGLDVGARWCSEGHAARVDLGLRSWTALGSEDGGDSPPQFWHCWWAKMGENWVITLVYSGDETGVEEWQPMTNVWIGKHGDECYEQFGRILFSDKTIDLNDLMVILQPGTSIQEPGGILNLTTKWDAEINLEILK